MMNTPHDHWEGRYKSWREREHLPPLHAPPHLPVNSRPALSLALACSLEPVFPSLSIGHEVYFFNQEGTWERLWSMGLRCPNYSAFRWEEG